MWEQDNNVGTGKHWGSTRQRMGNRTTMGRISVTYDNGQNRTTIRQPETTSMSDSQSFQPDRNETLGAYCLQILIHMREQCKTQFNSTERIKTTIETVRSYQKLCGVAHIWQPSEAHFKRPAEPWQPKAPPGLVALGRGKYVTLIAQAHCLVLGRCWSDDSDHLAVLSFWWIVLAGLTSQPWRRDRHLSSFATPLASIFF